MVAAQDLDDIQVHTNVIVHGSTWAAIWHIMTSLVQMFTIAIASFADIWVAGKLGSEVQAAIGIGGQVWYLMILMAVALCAGATAIVSRYWGARDIDGAVEAARQSLVFGFAFGVVSILFGLLIARPLFHFLGASPKVEQLGWDYLKFDLLSQLPFTLLWVTNSIFRAKGNARVPMLVWGLITAMTITLDFALCLGPFHLGISGIGLSWDIAAIVGSSLALFILSKSEIRACVDPRIIVKTGLKKEWIMRLLKIGAPTWIKT